MYFQKRSRVSYQNVKPRTGRPDELSAQSDSTRSSNSSLCCMAITELPTGNSSSAAPVLLYLPMQERVLHALNYCFLICDYLQLNPQYDLAYQVKQAGLLPRLAYESFRVTIKELQPDDDLPLTVSAA